MIVKNVGFGTTNAGPISNNGSVGLVFVERGAIGTAASTHQDTTGVATVFKGGYNLVGQDIYFTQSPRGNPQVEKTESQNESPAPDTQVAQKADALTEQGRIRAWLMDAVAQALGMELSELDSSAGFATMGLDSKEAVSITGELQDWLKRTLEPTLLFDYPNIDSLAKHLAQLQTGVESADEAIGSVSQVGGDIAVIGMAR